MTGGACCEFLLQMYKLYNKLGTIASEQNPFML
jgi:hypothetical protein